MKEQRSDSKPFEKNLGKTCDFYSGKRTAIQRLITTIGRKNGSILQFLFISLHFVVHFMSHGHWIVVYVVASLFIAIISFMEMFARREDTNSVAQLLSEQSVVASAHLALAKGRIVDAFIALSPLILALMVLVIDHIGEKAQYHFLREWNQTMEVDKAGVAEAQDFQQMDGLEMQKEKSVQVVVDAQKGS